MPDPPVWQTDRQTDRRTDKIAMAKTRYSSSCCHAKKNSEENNAVRRYRADTGGSDYFKPMLSRVSWVVAQISRTYGL